MLSFPTLVTPGVLSGSDRRDLSPKPETTRPTLLLSCFARKPEDVCLLCSGRGQKSLVLDLAVHNVCVTSADLRAVMSESDCRLVERVSHRHSTLPYLWKFVRWKTQTQVFVGTSIQSLSFTREFSSFKPPSAPVL